MNILGLISGSSLDGLDVALCKIEGQSPDDIDWDMSFGTTISFDDSLTHRLAAATSMSARDLLRLEVDFSNFCAGAIKEIIRTEDLKVDYICSHGHTIFHHPEEGYTLQIGKGSIIAEGTDIPCIVDIRANDIAQGGEGAPVAPIVEQYLYSGYDFYFNLGGIANVSYHGKDAITSIDSTPCNQVLNHIIKELGKPYDDKGLLARGGEISQSLIHQWGDLDYFDQPFPKSMDNSWVQREFIPIMSQHSLSHANRLASMVEFIAIQLKNDCQLLSTIHHTSSFKGLITGGGGFNDYLIERIQYHVKEFGLVLALPDADTINFKEAILMSLMGYLRVKQIANTIPTVTGAAKATVGGAIYMAS